MRECGAGLRAGIFAVTALLAAAAGPVRAEGAQATAPGEEGPDPHGSSGNPRTPR